MNSNTCSHGRSDQPTGRPPDHLAALAADLDALASEDRTALPEAVRAQRVQMLRRLADRLDGHWLKELAEVDAAGAAGADHGVPAASTASWLRHRLRLSHAAAHSAVQTARALFRGPLTKTAAALTSGDLSAAHASALAHGIRELPAQVAAEAEPTLVAAARRLDPPRLRRLVDHLRTSLDPDTADTQAQRQHERRGCGRPRPGRAWSPCKACWTQRPARSAGRPGALGPPGQRRRPSQRGSAPRRRPH